MFPLGSVSMQGLLSECPVTSSPVLRFDLFREAASLAGVLIRLPVLEFKDGESQGEVNGEGLPIVGGSSMSMSMPVNFARVFLSSGSPCSGDGTLPIPFMWWSPYETFSVCMV